MVRLATPLLLIVSIVLSGCGTSQPMVNNAPPATQQSDPFKVPEDTRSPLVRWMDENQVGKKAGIGLLVVGGVALCVAVLYAAAFAALLGNFH